MLRWQTGWPDAPELAWRYCSIISGTNLRGMIPCDLQNALELQFSR
jgi:hypothetical protein